MRITSTKRLLASLLAVSMACGTLASCGKTGSSESSSKESSTASTSSTVTEEKNDTPLVVGYARFSEKFSPFFASTAYDQDVASMTSISLLGTDRVGAVVEKGIEGETRSYNGTDYLYTGIADLTIDQKTDTTVYTFKIRDDIKFSDGEPLTIDDVIFSMYVYADPSFYGGASFGSMPIVGLRNYQTQTSDEVYEKYGEIFDQVWAAGEGNTVDGVDQAIADQLWEIVTREWTADIQGIVDYVYNNYASAYAESVVGKTAEEVGKSEGLKIALGMSLWGFGEVADGVLTGAVTGTTFDLTSEDTMPTIEDYYNEVHAAYGDVDSYDAAGESASGAIVRDNARAAFISEVGSQDESMGGNGVPNIAGIKKLSDTEVSVTLEGFDATAIYNLGVTVAPLHYYGDESLYDYDNNKFGFEFGDMSLIESKTTQPMGAGPYKFDRYENNVVYFEANENYFKGEPKIQNIQFKETDDKDKIAAVGTGTVDISDPSGSVDAFKEICSYNSNGELEGDVIVTNRVDNLGYGYIAMSAANVKVGDDMGSDASKALRKAFATVFSVYRDVVIDSYYGDVATVINYPISNTSWAAPQKTDEGYEVAFSTDADGNELYTADMSEEDKYAAALEGAISWFKAAGYTFDEASGKFTAAPEGASLSYEIIIPADGTGDHPSFAILTYAKAALETIGIELVINDPADSNVLWNTLDAGEAQMWVAAWGATPDPDMYQIYHSNNILGAGGTDDNKYNIVDDKLDKLIMDGRSSADQTFRKSIYKQALDIVLDWAVEIPVYQRQNCVIFSPERVNMDTVTPDITTYWDWMNDIELLEMN